MDAPSARKIEYGVTPTEVMASMAGIDFVRATFDGKLPTPPIMQTIEPFDLHGRAGRRRDPQCPWLPALQPDRLGAWRLRRDAAGFRDGARRAYHAAGGQRLHHARIQDQFYQRHDQDTGVVRSEGRVLMSAAAPPPPRPRITDAKGRLLAHATTTCLVFEIPL